MEVVPRAAIRGLRLLLDLAFIDGRKEEYSAYLKLPSAKLKRGGVLLAHSVIAPHPHELAGFLREVTETRSWIMVMLPVDPGV